MSMTRDAYAKEVKKAAEAALYRNENTACPHEDCNERLSVIRQSTFSTRSLSCPVHGHIFQEQESYPFGKLDWDKASERMSLLDDLEDDDSEDEDEIPGRNN